MRYVLFVVLCLAGVMFHSGLLQAQEAVASGGGILENPFDFSNPPTLPVVAAPSQSEIEESIRNGVRFLLVDQNPNGSWGSATRTKGLNIYAPVPGAHHAFRAATTSLCIAALLEVAPHDN
ncbi:MAG: hypothetical protein ABGZ53_34435, partial [Fuerstiella sp.]